MPGGPAGCLLLHGFLGSPREMLPLAEALAQEGWTVSVAQLAGHGTSPAALASSTCQDWVASARAALEDLQARCRTVALVGQSMGGALALYLAAATRPAAVVAISTPIRVRPVLVSASRAAARVLPLVPRLLRWRPREREMRPYRSAHAWVPLGLTGEVDRLLHQTREALAQVQAPILVVQGRWDLVIPRESGESIVRLARRAPARLLWLKRSGHVATLDRDRHALYAAVTGFLRPLLQSATAS